LNILSTLFNDNLITHLTAAVLICDTERKEVNAGT
jgi:hypothetical protein